MMIVDINFAALMDEIQRRTMECATSATDPGELKAHTLLYAVISSCTAGRALRIVMGTPRRDGREAMRRLDAESRPAMKSRQMGLLNMILKPELEKSKTGQEYMDRLSMLQGTISEYEQASGAQLNASIKVAILMDGAPTEDGGRLLQIFTDTVIGPIFFEVIQRKGDDGFGEGNFKALFESIELDQIRRGVLKA